jgi:apolipoprotein N-acyltransferase
MSSQQTNREAFLLLALFAILSLFTSGKWVVAPLIWIAPIFALRFMRGQKVWLGVVPIWLAIFIPSTFSWYKLQPFPMPEYLIFMAIAALFGVLPLLVDRLLTPHLGSRFAATLIFPLAVTTTEYVTMSSANPMGSFGAQGYTQYGLPIVMQLATVTGLWGITFVTSWFASVVNWVWERNFNWSQIRRGVAIYGAVLLLVVAYGGGRLFFAPESADTVTIASFTVEETHAGELFALLEADEVAFRDKTTALHAAYLKQTVQAARNGAEIVMWPEQAGFGLEEDVLTLLEQGQAIAAEESIYLAMPVFIIFPDRNRLIENKLFVVDPNGEFVLEHVKYGGNALEGTLPGGGILQTFETPYGKLSGIICWDTDYPLTVSQAGRLEVDILLSPSKVWQEMGPMHAAMATFRAVENGLVIVRQEDQGISIMVDAFGRTMATADHFAGERTLWVEAPIASSVPTIYPRIGNAVGQLAVLGFVIMAVWAIIGGRMAKRQAEDQQAPLRPAYDRRSQKVD